jgi:hypothetical protein
LSPLLWMILLLLLLRHDDGVIQYRESTDDETERTTKTGCA